MAPPSHEVAVVPVPPGVRVTARMPTPDEREHFGLVDEDTPVLVVVLPGNRYTLKVTGDD